MIYPQKISSKKTDLIIDENGTYSKEEIQAMQDEVVNQDVVVMAGDDLCKLIKELTGCMSVEIEAEVDIACCGKSTKYNTIKNIICIDFTGTRLDFEIEYNKEFRVLQDYKISTYLTYDKEPIQP